MSETRVLENHLQGRLAAAIPCRLQEADPVRCTHQYRWLTSHVNRRARSPVAALVREGSAGTPVKPHAVRKRLLNSSQDLAGRPRAALVLLDEACASIDDAARAHCTDRVREFELHFVMASERERTC